MSFMATGGTWPGAPGPEEPGPLGGAAGLGGGGCWNKIFCWPNGPVAALFRLLRLDKGPIEGERLEILKCENCDRTGLGPLSTCSRENCGLSKNGW